MRPLLPCILLLFSLVIVALGTSPVAVNWSTRSYGPDGPWQVTKSAILYLPIIGVNAKRRQLLSKWAPTRPETPFQRSTYILEDCTGRRSTRTHHAATPAHPPRHVLRSQQDFTVLSTLSAPIRTALSRRQPLISGNGEVPMRRMRASLRGASWTPYAWTHPVAFSAPKILQLRPWTLIPSPYLEALMQSK